MVVGTSCVDFSGQNNQRSRILKDSRLETEYKQSNRKGATANAPTGPEEDEMVQGILSRLRVAMHEPKAGESATTFSSVLTFLFYKRPAIVLIENVANAPWDQFVNFWLPLVGYKAGFVHLNSKYFLVPQTRQRGYLLAVDHRLYGDASSDIIDAWKKIMGQKWFEAIDRLGPFLCDGADPKVLETRYLKERQVAENQNRDNEARMCMYEHQKARDVEELGDGRPYTMKDVRSQGIFREGSWTGYLRGLAFRVPDLIDILFLRASKKGGYDLAHKEATADVSQNVYRTKPKFGDVSCILPDGMILLLDQGRFVIGQEALNLQGIPTDRIGFSVETQSQLHDLAGNAMTTTVVGVALIMAIVSEQEAVHASDSDDEIRGLGLQRINTKVPISERLQSMLQSKRNRPDMVLNLIDPNDMKLKDAFSTTRSEKNIADILQGLYPLIRRYCICRGYRKRNTACNLQKCSTCDEVRCDSCAGNPKHHFFPEVVNAVMPAEDTVMLLRSLLPGRLIWSEDTHFDAAQWAVDIESRRRTKIAHPDGRALFGKIVESLSTALTSYHYMDNISVENEVGINFRSTSTSIRLVIGRDEFTWLFFSKNDLVVSEKARIDRFQPLARVVIPFKDKPHSIMPSVAKFQVFIPESRNIKLRLTPGHNAMTVAVQEWVHDDRHMLDNILGTYTYSSVCSTPLGHVYSKGGEIDKLRPFMIIDSHPTRPEKGKWIISDTIAKQTPSTHREIRCSFPKDFDLPAIKDPVAVDCSIHGFWVECAEPPCEMVMDGSSLFHDQESISYAGDMYGFFPDIQQKPTALVELNLPIKDLHFNVPVFGKIWDEMSEAFKKGHSTDDMGDRWLRVPEMYQKDAFSLVKHALYRMVSNEIAKEWFVESADVTIFQKLDQDTQLPPAYHLWEPSFKNSKAQNTFNDPDTIMAAKKKYTSRPLPIELDVRLDKKSHRLHVRVFINPTALAHEAWMSLPHEGVERGIRRHAANDSRVGVRVHNRVRLASLKNLRPFADVFTIKRDNPDQDVTRPRSFSKTGHTLHKDQLETLSWMLEKEDSCEKFCEQEFFESWIPSSDTRIVGFAKTINRSRGGVLAHDVGFGKSVVTLALIDRTTEGNKRQESVEERRLWTGDRHTHLKATLILCPPQIVLQWKSEAIKFLGRGWKIVTIEKEKDIHEANLKAADIIIVNSNILSKPSYLRDLTKAAGGPHDVAHDKLSTRAYRDLYRQNLDDLSLLLKTAIKTPNADLAVLTESIRQGHEKAVQDVLTRSIPESTRAGAKKARKDQTMTTQPAAQTPTAISTTPKKTTSKKSTLAMPTLLYNQPPGPKRTAPRRTTPRKSTSKLPSPNMTSIKLQSLAKSTVTQPALAQPTLKKPAARKCLHAKSPRKKDTASSEDFDDNNPSASQLPSSLRRSGRSTRRPVKYTADNEKADGDENAVEDEKADEDVSDPEIGRAPEPEDPFSESSEEEITRPRKKPAPKNDKTSESAQNVRAKITACTFLEMYSFTRVVLDEFSYENRAISAFFTNVIASSKWILSGTPPLQNLGQVCNIGDLLNIHVARVENRNPEYFPGVTHGPKMDAYTQTEQFRIYGEPMSTNFALDRHEQAFKFLEHKLQRRETFNDQITVSEEVVVVNLDPTTALVYFMLQQALNEVDFDVEELADHPRSLVDSILAAAYGKDHASKRANVKEHIRKSWQKSIQTLLVQASTNLSMYAKHIKEDPRLSLGPKPSAQDFLTAMIRVKESELADHRKRLKSHFDALMYCRVRADDHVSRLAANSKDKKRHESQSAKNGDYSKHFGNMIGRIFNHPEQVGSTKIRDDLLAALAPV